MFIWISKETKLNLINHYTIFSLQKHPKPSNKALIHNDYQDSALVITTKSKSNTKKELRKVFFGLCEVCG
jgi:hypothetical protein